MVLRKFGYVFRIVFGWAWGFTVLETVKGERFRLEVDVRLSSRGYGFGSFIEGFAFFVCVEFFVFLFLFERFATCM